MSLESATAQMAVELLKAAVLSEIREHPGLAGEVTTSLGFRRTDWPSKPHEPSQRVLTSIFDLLIEEKKALRIGNEWRAK